MVSPRLVHVRRQEAGAKRLDLDWWILFQMWWWASNARCFNEYATGICNHEVVQGHSPTNWRSPFAPDPTSTRPTLHSFKRVELRALEQDSQAAVSVMSLVILPMAIV